MLLGAKVIVGGARRDSVLLGDRAHRRLLISTLAEHLQRGLQNQRPGLLALAARFSRLHGQRSLVQSFFSQGSIPFCPGRLISESTVHFSLFIVQCSFFIVERRGSGNDK